MAVDAVADRVAAHQRGYNWPHQPKRITRYSNAKMRFQSFFMLTTIQPSLVASS